MMNSSLGDLDVVENYYQYKNISDSYEYEEGINLYNLGEVIWQTTTLMICCIGLVGNGYIIWLLGFQIKRNSCTTFILNLAVADFGYLTFLFLYIIVIFIDFLGSGVYSDLCFFVINMMYVNTNFLLTAISIDRCVAVLFPIWHRCSRPKHLSFVVCFLLWISSFLLCGTSNIADVDYHLPSFHLFVTGIVCLPLTTLSTTVLFIKVCLKSNQRNQGRLLLLILITLLCFLILAFPISVLILIKTFSYNMENYSQVKFWFLCSIVFSCLNSSINPVIYFLVGRRKGARSKESMKVILQKVFKEGEATGGR